MLQWTWGHRYLFSTVFSFPSRIYPEEGLLDHVVVLSLVFWGTTILFSIPTNTIRRFSCRHSFIKACYLFVIKAIRTGARWNLVVLFSCLPILELLCSGLRRELESFIVITVFRILAINFNLSSTRGVPCQPELVLWFSELGANGGSPLRVRRLPYEVNIGWAYL